VAVLERAIAELDGRVPSAKHGKLERPGLAALSVRELEVVLLVARGLTDKQIAEELVLSPRTIQSHVASALRKTGTSRRTELAALAIHERLAPPG
jgi:DNA-binding NarL/FixJ family response regulator